jgi:hypothetical protein
VLILLPNEQTVTIFKSAWGALDQYRRTTLWVVGSIPVGAPRMLLWKKNGFFPIIVDAATSHWQCTYVHCLFRCLYRMSHREKWTCDRLREDLDSFTELPNYQCDNRFTTNNNNQLVLQIPIGASNTNWYFKYQLVLQIPWVTIHQEEEQQQQSGYKSRASLTCSQVKTNFGPCWIFAAFW